MIETLLAGQATNWAKREYDHCQIIIFSSSNQGHQLTIRNHNPDNIERQGAKYRSVLINMRTGVFAFGGLGVHLFDAAG